MKNKIIAWLVSTVFFMTGWIGVIWSTVNYATEVHWLLFWGAFGCAIVISISGIIYERIANPKRLRGATMKRRVTDQAIDIGHVIHDDMYLSTQSRLED